MGDEIKNSQFSAADYENYYHFLCEETQQLNEFFANNQNAPSWAKCGIEQEAWIINENYFPEPANQYLLKNLPSELLSPELSQFNIELNVTPQLLQGRGIFHMHEELQQLWNDCEAVLAKRALHIQMIGILPTLRDQDLVLEYMSHMNRYQALNDQVMKSRKGKPLRLEIVGVDHLKSLHEDVMLESAATSFQIHRQIPNHMSARYYNSAVLLSAPMVAICANSPFLFGKQLWDETRIPLFEQAVEVGGYGDAAHGPIRRVTFGSGYAKHSVMECFNENRDHYPVLLPVKFPEQSNKFSHLRMHNGTIWRWNRPLVGFNEDGSAHLRIEHRVVSAGPTIVDEIANAMLFYGLQEYYATTDIPPEDSLLFSASKQNFYSAAQHGLNAKLQWIDGARHNIKTLFTKELLPNALNGLRRLHVDAIDIENYLDVIKGRLDKMQTGAEWQKAYAKQHGYDMESLSGRYFENQQSGKPVHEWMI